MEIDVQQLPPAERLLWSYGVTQPSHIDLDAIANDKDARVIYRPLDGCEARLVVREDLAIISVNSKSNDGRQRFSLAHELCPFNLRPESGFVPVRQRRHWAAKYEGQIRGS